jgi:hypothetical protein
LRAYHLRSISADYPILNSFYYTFGITHCHNIISNIA